MPDLIDLFFNRLRALHRSFLSLPDFLKICRLTLEFFNLLLEKIESLLGSLIFFLTNRLSFDL